MKTYTFPPTQVYVAPSPISYMLDGTAVVVTRDTSVITNSRPLPVEIMSASGVDINITAGDINVQLSDQGANPDVTKIGDGTNRLGINSNLEAKVHDADSLVQVSAINTKLTSQATAALQTTGNASLASIDGKISTKTLGTQVTTTDNGLIVNAVIHGINTTGGGAYVDIKANSSGALTTETTIVSSTLPSGAATSALQTTGNSSLSSIDTKLTNAATTTLQTTANTKLDSIITNTTSIATSALQTTGNTSLGSIDTNQGAKADTVASSDTGTFSLIALVKKVAQNITAMAAQLPATLGIKTAANSLSVAPASDAKFSIKPSTITTTYAENLALTTVTTITAPANAVSVLVMADDANANNIRIKQNGTASLTSGFPIQAGRDITFEGGQDLSVISDNNGSAGASVKIYFSWKVQA